jgi:hypothetical protein
MAGVTGFDSVWAGRAAPGLVAAFEAGRARLAPAGLTVALVQARWREPVGGGPWIDPVASGGWCGCWARGGARSCAPPFA